MTITKSDWNGYEQLNFEVEGRASFVVCPKTPAPGNPWVWRTEFFGAFDTVDRELLNRGWHLAYHSMSELYGSPLAMQYMSEFQDAVEKELGLGPHPSLFGFSRGGCYAVNYGYTAPDRVGVLYLDAPYLDFVGNDRLKESEVVPNLLRAYGLSWAQLHTFGEMPLHRAVALGRAGVPIVACVGLADEAVPYEKNMGLFAPAFTEAGGNLLLIKKPECGHHPHSVSDPEGIARIADFIETNTK